ncbi:hypothetical protein CONPUDRAFT_140456 [Coniophora puteana RWD-64-598 SS2]|uniref:Uncharacterized protein n=1 Tax=Coniophora puteana (strain RWD-64-598) TaxID=741705 RepID=R7SI59_CONPW|nr:uncharacterized protein CONPUDRAFT_140456 [Coniophora puteana RWD-64-598 SS2]EIW74709.1 hypothetical protein CONPUDRAFT_140456 [Coniophora puteana RWD-64-598 SS2]
MHHPIWDYPRSRDARRDFVEQELIPGLPILPCCNHVDQRRQESSAPSASSSLQYMRLKMNRLEEI